MLRKNLLAMIEEYQVSLETTPGVFNSEKTVERNGGQFEDVSIRFGKTSEWEQVEKFRQYVRFGLSQHDDISAVVSLYPVLVSNKYFVDPALLAKAARLACDSLKMDQKEIDASVKHVQLASMGMGTTMFGGHADMNKLDLVTRVKYIEARLPILTAKHGAEMEMQPVVNRVNL